MVLAAGLGHRMRLHTNAVPKPLVQLAGRALIDHVLDRLPQAGFARAVVNVHHKAAQIEAHLRNRRSPQITISDERNLLLDTGGGVRKALAALQSDAARSDPFLVHNSDSVWIEHGVSNLHRLEQAWDACEMDAVLLLAHRDGCLGYTGRGDFHLQDDGRIHRPAAGAATPYVFAGVSYAHPRLMRDTEPVPFSLNRVWDRAMGERRLFGLVLEGLWMHVGDPAALAAAEHRLIAEGASVAERPPESPLR